MPSLLSTTSLPARWAAGVRTRSSSALLPLILLEGKSCQSLCTEQSRIVADGSPEAEAAQKSCCVGGPSGAPPGIGRYFTRKGSKSTSWTLAWATFPRYLATAASG